jgi:hypothetical protein
MSVKPVGRVVIEKHDERDEIPASAIVQGPSKKEADGPFGESEEWSVTFTATSRFGDFGWRVIFTVGSEGLHVMDWERVKAPADVYVISDVSFHSA